ncbi:dihydrolipoyl dehydrogenase [Dysosmobacter sp.]|uniref:dihydrolipoyl dehydrogenase n=1 Tax=Dysosmobacter sp. TaxID=2591382 RepID=UPI003AB276F9
MQKFDAVVVGGGPGGYECAIRLSQNGLKTALVEEAELGGTCLNRGCIPTKTLLHSADIYHDAKNGAPFGVNAGALTFDYAKIIERKNAVAKQLSNGVAFLEKNHGVTVFASHATLADRNTVELANGETLQCDHLIVATGSSPARIPISGVDLPGVVDSTGLLNMTTCPKHIIIVGGGVIGVEFATFFYRLGVPVTIVEMLDRVLGPLDKDITDFVEAELKRCGVELVLGVRVESIEAGLKVNYAAVKDGAKGSVEGDVVLMAGGRAPNTKGIGLEKLGVRMDRKGFVEIDGLCRTNVPGVYAIGDVNGKMQLAHVASAQGLLVADHIAGKPCKQLNYNRIPSCVYCNPETAMVGLTEEQARATGREIGIGTFNLSGNGKALTMGENKGLVKFVYDKATDEILGFHVIGPRATDLAAEVAAVMECEGTVAEIGRTVHPHPTVSEVVMEAAHVCHGSCVNAPKPRK